MWILQSEPQGARTLVWALPRSLAATYGIDIFSFSSSGYLDVSVHRVPSVHLWIQCTVTEVSSAGFPHSDICGSMDICSSPQLFAAYHVFLRLLVPRHPPCALFSLTCCTSFAAAYDVIGGLSEACFRKAWRLQRMMLAKLTSLRGRQSPGCCLLHTAFAAYFRSSS